MVGEFEAGGKGLVGAIALQQAEGFTLPSTSLQFGAGELFQLGAEEIEQACSIAFEVTQNGVAPMFFSGPGA